MNRVETGCYPSLEELSTKNTIYTILLRQHIGFVLQDSITCGEFRSFKLLKTFLRRGPIQSGLYDCEVVAFFRLSDIFNA